MVPRSLEDSPATMDEDIQSENPTLVICSGELIEQVPLNTTLHLYGC